MGYYVPPYSSQVILSPESVRPGQERGLCAPRPAGGGPDGGCRALNGQGLSRDTGAGSRVRVLVGGGAIMGSPQKGWAQP